MYCLTVVLTKVTSGGSNSANGVAMTSQTHEFRTLQARSRAREAIQEQIRSDTNSGLRPAYLEFETDTDPPDVHIDYGAPFGEGSR